MASTIVQPRSWTSWYNSPNQLCRPAPTHAAFDKIIKSFSGIQAVLTPKYATLLIFPDISLVRYSTVV
jgi:hypothetical protein